MRHLILLIIIFSNLQTQVHGEDVPDYETFLQDQPFLQDPEVSNGEVVYDDSTNVFPEDLSANPSNKCLSYDDVDNIFLPDEARVRLRRGICPNSDTPPPLTPPLDIYDSNNLLNLLSTPLKTPVTSGPSKDADYWEQLFGPPLSAPTQKDENEDCPADLYGDSRTLVCQLGSFKRDVELVAGELHYTVYNVRFRKFQAIIISDRET